MRLSPVLLPLLALGTSALAQIAVEKGGQVLRFTAAGRPMFTYQMEPGPRPPEVPASYAHGGYLHPVFTPGGRLVTADFPPDHRHQRGIFFAWTKTEFGARHPDFWNMGKGETGAAAPAAEVRFEALEKSWGENSEGGFVSRHRFLDHTGGDSVSVLEETWTVRARQLTTDGRTANVIDLSSAQRCAGRTPLRLPKYHYGGLGVRGSAQWDAVEAVTMLTSNGDDRTKGDATKARWVWMGGLVDGAPAGIAVLIHPANFRFPQPLRLHPKNPQLCVAPSQDGDWSIEPGQTFVSRYRLLALDGSPEAAWLEARWKEYAESAPDGPTPR